MADEENHMADEENQPPKHQEAQSQPPAAQPRQADDEPKVEAVQNEPKTPASAQRSKRESRFSVLTALISALAALFGALVGGVSSYVVAQCNNTAQADEAQITRRETTYADYMTQQSDFATAQHTLVDALQLIPPPANTQVNAYLEHYRDEHDKSLHSDYSVRLVESPGVDPARKAIFDLNGNINNDIISLGPEYNPGLPLNGLNQSDLADLNSRFDAEEGMLDNFPKAAAPDTARRKQGLLSCY